MTQIDLGYLGLVLTPRCSTLVEDNEEQTRLAAEFDNLEDDSFVDGYLSRTGRVLAWRNAKGERFVYEGEVSLRVTPWPDDLPNPFGMESTVTGWDPTGTPRVYRSGAANDAEHADDTLRLFIAHSVRTQSTELFAGWRDRFVTVIPEEVGMKETKVVRSTTEGQLEQVHTYNALDAVGQYAQWVNDLAMEFSGTDEALSRASFDPVDLGPLGAQVIQSWLMREAAEAALQNARTRLKSSLPAMSIMAQMSGTKLNVSEWARSLHTDRANLAKLSKPAPGSDLAQLMNTLAKDEL